MYGLVIYTKPVACISDMVYGRMYHLANTEEIIFQAILDYQRLLFDDAWLGKSGQFFRETEGWRAFEDEDGVVDWRYEGTYSFETVDYIPDEFIRQVIPTLTERICLLSSYVVLKFADLNMAGYLVNQSFYDSVMGTTDLQWRPVIPTIEKNGPLLEGKS